MGARPLELMPVDLSPAGVARSLLWPSAALQHLRKRICWTDKIWARRYQAIVISNAARRLELAVLSVLAHGEGEQGAAIAAAVLPAIQELDDDRARLYYDLVYNSLNTAARRALEELMKGYEYQSDFAKKYVAQGRTEGLSQGLTQGRTEEAARNLLTVLRVRGFAVPDHIRERILAETDPERLERWLEKAVVAPSLAALIDEPN